MMSVTIEVLKATESVEVEVLLIELVLSFLQESTSIIVKK
jgi:hypothetical protein